MKKRYRIISLLLTALLLLGSLSALSVVSVFAADESGSDSNTGTDTDTDGEGEEGEESSEDNYTSKVYATPQEKLATMELKLTKGNYQLYVDDFSGEVATVNTVTGEILFTNPYDVGASTGSESTKQQILSQIVVRYTDNDTEKYFYSYEMAALRDQIVVKNIKNGIRVEYTIGREQAKLLLPRLISKERFEEAILAPMAENMIGGTSAFMYGKFDAYYMLKDLDELTSERAKQELIASFPIVQKMPVYVFDPDASDAEKTLCEELIKTYCPDYTYEDLDADHALTEYVSEEENPPLFKMALEYTLDDKGMSVRLPANGIRFNESLYQLSYISVLPYMGAGNSEYTGYNFYPDGSGTLFSFEDLDLTTTTTVSGKVYGTDFAYHEISGTYQQTIRYPVFGVVEDTVFYNYTDYDSDTDEQNVYTINGAIVNKINEAREQETTSELSSMESSYGPTYGSIVSSSSMQVEKVESKRGYMAVIEEGDALAEISTYHAGSLSDYNTMQMQFNPRPRDSYNVADSISVGTNSTWTVVSSRKYVGSYKIRYIMLSEYDEEAEAQGVKTYDASWFGMAVAYRDYLTDEGILSPLTSDEIIEDIPLYIETFGTIETLQKVMSIPVSVMTPLTTFDDIKKMYEDMNEGGIKNVNFKLTGYANGGLYETVPYKFDIEKAVEGDLDFQVLLNYAAEMSAEENSNLGIFPDFDFNYIKYVSSFDGVSTSKHAAKTIDDRYASRREYSPTQQKYVNYYELVISPAYFSRFYEKLTENYLGAYENVTGISVSTLGMSLNSDFDEDEPYNREDAKEFTIKAFQFFDENYDQVMTEGGNAYTWKYVDHILGVALDSSRYNKASAAVPFIGVVLHGSMNFAGTALNMEGNMQYAILKALENGASPYFILSYQNTQYLKEDYLFSQYYSVRYDIWKDDMIEAYNTINEALKDVQDKFIIAHEFLSGVRVPDADELEADLIDQMNEYAEAEKNAVEIAQEELMMAVGNARAAGRLAESFALESVLTALEAYNNVYTAYDTAKNQRLQSYINAKEALDELVALGYDKLEGSEDEESQAHYEEYQTAYNTYVRERNRAITAVSQVGGTYLSRLQSISETMVKNIEEATAGIAIVANAQKDSIQYAEGKPGDIWSIENFNELTPVTQEMIEHVRVAVDLFNNFKLEAIEEEELILNGTEAGTLDDEAQTPVYSVSVFGSGKLYYTGSDEDGYTFYSLNEETDVFTPVEEYETVRYAVLDGDDTVYYLQINDTEFGYYTYDSSKNTFNSVDREEAVHDGEVFTTLDDDTVVYVERGEDGDIYYSGTSEENYIYYEYTPSIAEYYEDAQALFDEVLQIAVENGITEEEIRNRINIGNNQSDDEEDDDEEDEYSKYETENIVAVTYGTASGEAYKVLILNYNNYAVNVVYNDIEYTIPAYGFVSLLV